jgi:hypothetical protein
MDRDEKIRERYRNTIQERCKDLRAVVKGVFENNCIDSIQENANALALLDTPPKEGDKV